MSRSRDNKLISNTLDMFADHSEYMRVKDRRRRALWEYFQEKQAMGIIEPFQTAFLTTGQSVAFYVQTGAYQGIIEPWLRRFARDNWIDFSVFVRYIGGAAIRRRELHTLPPEFQISVRIGVTPCFREKGMVTYV